MSVVIIRRSREAPEDSLDGEPEVLHEAYEWESTDQATGGIFLMLFQSRLFKKTLVGFLESQRDNITSRFPDDVPAKGAWAAPEAERTFMKCFVAGVFRFKAVTEYLTAETPEGYKYEIHVLKLNHTDGIPIKRPPMLSVEDIKSLAKVERITAAPPDPRDYAADVPGMGDPTAHNAGVAGLGPKADSQAKC